MNIRIKELFKSDLDPNSNEWWSKDKIDKINFNFNLLRNGGPQGPMGLEGPNGVDGDKGDTGAEGNQGPFGFQGLIGPESEGTWKSYDIGSRIVIYPSVASNISGITIPIIGASSHEDGSGNLISPYYGTTATSPINLAGSGAINVLNEGPMSIPGFGNYSNLSSIQIIENLDYSNSFNFGLTSFDNGSGNTAVFEIKPSYNNTSPNSQQIKFKGDVKFDFISNQGNINTLGVNSGINYPLEVIATDPGQTIEFTVGQLKFNQDASLNNILKSNDTLGTVTWENVASLFSVLPIGSIVRIPSTDFNSSNFYTDDSNTINNGPVVGGNGVYDIRTNFGAGKIDGMFGGWYLCNGEKWGDGGIITYDTPNLNGFSYQISNIQSETYGNSPSVSGGNSHSGNILYSGSESNINMNGSVIEQSNSSSDTNAYLHNASLTNNDEYHIVFGEQVSIIFLGDYNYMWSNYDPNLTTSDISLSYHELANSIDQDGNDISMRYAASLQPETRQWTADIAAGSLPAAIDAYWVNNTNFNNQGVSTGIRVYDNGIEINSGWLYRANNARYYEAGVGFTGNAISVINYECWMLYGEAVNDVDGNAMALFPNTAPLALISESDISNNNTLNLQEMYVSSNFENSPLVTGTAQDLTDYEQNTHIWSVDLSNNTIVVPTTGWYRSIPYSASYSISFGFGNPITIAAGHILGYRKYWNQNDNEFKADTIKDNYVPWSLGKFRLASGAGANTVACGSSGGHDIFFSIDSIESGIVGHSSAYEVENFSSTASGGGTNWTFAQLYVRADSNPQTSGGSLSNKGKYPLRLVKSDTYIPGTNSNLVMARPNFAEYKEINTSSMAPGSTLACPVGLISSGVYFSIDEPNFIETTTGQLSNLGAEFIPRGSANNWEGNGGAVKSVNYYVTGNNPSTPIDVDIYTVEIASTQTNWIDQTTYPNPSGMDWMWFHSGATGIGGQGIKIPSGTFQWTDSNGTQTYTVSSGNVLYKHSASTYTVGSDTYDIYFEFNEAVQWVPWPTGIYNGTWPHECVKVHFVPTSI